MLCEKRGLMQLPKVSLAGIHKPMCEKEIY